MRSTSHPATRETAFFFPPQAVPARGLRGGRFSAGLLTPGPPTAPPADERPAACVPSAAVLGCRSALGRGDQSP